MADSIFSKYRDSIAPKKTEVENEIIVSPNIISRYMEKISEERGKSVAEVSEPVTKKENEELANLLIGSKILSIDTWNEAMK